MNTGTLAIRLPKILIAAGLALWAFLVTFGNLSDYDNDGEVQETS